MKFQPNPGFYFEVDARLPFRRRVRLVEIAHSAERAREQAIRYIRALGMDTPRTVKVSKLSRIDQNNSDGTAGGLGKTAASVSDSRASGKSSR